MLAWLRHGNLAAWDKMEKPADVEKVIRRATGVLGKAPAVSPSYHAAVNSQATPA
jgi:hypothetical protein